jgi:hypothetical protein
VKHCPCNCHECCVPPDSPCDDCEAWHALARHGYDPDLPARGVTGPPAETITNTVTGVTLRNRVCFLDGIEIDGHEVSDLDPNGGCIHCEWEPE